MPRTIVEYQSTDYGIFLIGQAGTKFNVWWDPEECNEGCLLDEELENDYFDFCQSNSKNLSIKDFLDVPSDGLFNTFQEAYDYIVSKFGLIT